MQTKQTKRPNIILFLTDQQRWDTLSHFGVQSGVTPNLDRLGETGTLFERFFTVQPVCGPARACLQSGRYASETGNYKNGRTLPPCNDNLGEQMKQAGYDTAYVGKWHIFGDKNPFLRGIGYDVPAQYRAGYDYWLASNALEFTSHIEDGYVFDNRNKKVPIVGNRVDFLTDRAIEYLRNRGREKSFFLILSQLEPHQQNDLGRFCGPPGSKERFKDAPLPEDLKHLKGDYPENFADYLGACAKLDENVGKLEAYLHESGQWDDTLLIYTSDHGCHFKTRNGEYKRSCHDASLRTPCVMHGPGFVGRGAVGELGEIIDLPPTILHAAGVSSPACYRGSPLGARLDGAAPEKDAVFAQISESETGRCMRTKRWKYGVSGGSSFDALTKQSVDTYYETYLYDLDADPAELTNLAGDERYAAVREELRGRLLGWISEVERATPQILPLSARPEKKRYSFDMTLYQMKQDEKSMALLQEHLPMLLKSKAVRLGENLSFEFLKQYMVKVPFLGRKVKKFESALDRLND